jgi:hypothetical protein
LVYDICSVSVNYFLTVDGQGVTDGNPKERVLSIPGKYHFNFLEFLLNPDFVIEDDAPSQIVIATHILHYKTEKVPFSAVATFLNVTKGIV